MTLTAEVEKLSDLKFDPVEALDDAVRAIQETAEVQFGETFEITDIPGDLDGGSFGSSISLAGEDGGMILAILCDQQSSEALTRLLFAMEEDEDVPLEDLADGLNEIVNVAAGVLKGYRSDHGQALNLGLPLFLEGGNSLKFVRSGVQEQARVLRGDDGSEIQVYLIWQEGTGK